MRHFKDWIFDGFLEYTRVREAPEASHLWTGIWTIAGALRRNVWFDMGGFDFTPNFYIVLTGPPGVIQKSTTAKNGSRLLAHVPGVVFGPDSATWHGLIPKFQGAEAVTETSRGPLKVSPVSMAVSELGSFLKLSQEGLDAVLIDMWDGAVDVRPWVHTTQTHGDKSIWNGQLNLIGCTTLGWLRENIPASALETGLISRMLFVYADKKRELISVPKLDRRWAPKAQAEREEKLIHDLIDIGKLRGPFEMDADAYEWQDGWYKEHQSKRPEALVSERFDVYRSRRQPHVFKLAMVLAASRNVHPRIRLSEVRDAVGILEKLDLGVARIFETIGGPKESVHVREIISVIGREPSPVTFGRLLRLLGGAMTHDEVAMAIRAAVTAGLIKSVPTEERDHRGTKQMGLRVEEKVDEPRLHSVGRPEDREFIFETDAETDLSEG